MATYSYERTIHFSDTDAAGVVFFARYYAICHEAYEEALQAAGLPLAQFFGSGQVALPIGASSATYRRPLTCGDRIRVNLRTERLGPDSFAIHYELLKLGHPDKQAALVRTEHICISTSARERSPLPPALADWVAQA